jgi:hypothetical protein
MPPYYYQEKAFVQTTNSRTRTARPARHITLYKQNSCLNEQYNPRKCPKRRFTCRYQLYQQIVDAKGGE